jgi:hypothetical protein
MTQSGVSEGNIRSALQEIPCLSWNTTRHATLFYLQPDEFNPILNVIL